MIKIFFQISTHYCTSHVLCLLLPVNVKGQIVRTLKCVKISLHSTMGQERLSALALMSIHRSMPIDFDNVVEFYVKEEFLRKTKE